VQPASLKTSKETKQTRLSVGEVFDAEIISWIEPLLIAEIRFTRHAPDKMFREPVFVRLRLDLS